MEGTRDIRCIKHIDRCAVVHIYMVVKTHFFHNLRKDTLFNRCRVLSWLFLFRFFFGGGGVTGNIRKM